MNQLDRRNIEDSADAILGALDEILRELKRLNDKLASGSASSVEVKTSTRGVDVAVKSYAGSDVEAAGDAAVDEYRRVMTRLSESAMNGFTAEATKAR